MEHPKSWRLSEAQAVEWLCKELGCTATFAKTVQVPRGGVELYHPTGYILYTIYYILYIICYILDTRYYILYTMYCILYTLYYAHYLYSRLQTVGIWAWDDLWWSCFFSRLLGWRTVSGFNCEASSPYTPVNQHGS